MSLDFPTLRKVRTITVNLVRTVHCYASSNMTNLFLTSFWFLLLPLAVRHRMFKHVRHNIVGLKSPVKTVMAE